MLIRCDKCKSLHLIADNLGWFDDNKINIESILKEKLENIIKIDVNS